MRQPTTWAARFAVVSLLVVQAWVVHHVGTEHGHDGPHGHTHPVPHAHVTQHGHAPHHAHHGTDVPVDDHSHDHRGDHSAQDHTRASVYLKRAVLTPPALPVRHRDTDLARDPAPIAVWSRPQDQRLDDPPPERLGRPRAPPLPFVV